MSGEPVAWIAVVCESEADSATAADLADRVICAEIDWITPDVLDDYRQFRGFAATDRCLTWARAKGLANSQHVRSHGHFRGELGAPDALAARRVLLLLLMARDPPTAVLLVRDMDDQPERAHGLKQARDDRPWQFAVIVGAALTKRECWVLNGFDPADQNERQLLEQEERKLGFDPRTEGHRLTAKHDTDKLSAKRVLATLTSGDTDRQRRCWNECPLATLTERGEQTGLGEFLRELRARLAPLFR